MPRTFAIRADVLLALGFASGLVVGLLAGRLWAQDAEQQARITYYHLATTVHRLGDPAGWAHDSIVRERYFRAFPRPQMPREVQRTQFASDCLVTYQFPDTTPGEIVALQLWARDSRGSLLARGGAYAEDGFGPGARITVVVPNLRCESAAGFGLTIIPAPPPAPLRWAPLVPLPDRKPNAM